MGVETFLVNMDAAQTADLVAIAPSASDVVENLALLEGGLLAAGSDPSTLFPATSSFLRDYQQGRDIDWNRYRLLIAGELRQFATNPERRQSWQKAMARMPWPSKPPPTQPFRRFESPAEARAYLRAHLQAAPNGVGVSVSGATTATAGTVGVRDFDLSKMTPADVEGMFDAEKMHLVRQFFAVVRTESIAFYTAVKGLSKETADFVPRLRQLHDAYKNKMDHLLSLAPVNDGERINVAFDSFLASLKQNLTALDGNVVCVLRALDQGSKEKGLEILREIVDPRRMVEIEDPLKLPAYRISALTRELGEQVFGWLSAGSEVSRREGTAWIFESISQEGPIQENIIPFNWPLNPEGDIVLRTALDVLGWKMEIIRDGDDIAAIRLDMGEGSWPLDQFSHAVTRSVPERLAMARNIFDDFYTLFNRQEQTMRRLLKDDIEGLTQIFIAFRRNFDERKKLLLGLFPNPGEERLQILVHDLKSSIVQMQAAIQSDTEAGISDLREGRITWQQALDAIPSARSLTKATLFEGTSYLESIGKGELAKNFVAWIQAHHPASQSLEEGGGWLVTFSKGRAADSIEKEIALKDSPWPPDPKSDPVLKTVLSILGLTLHSVEAEGIVVLRIGPFREKPEVELKKWRAVAEGVDRPKAMAALGNIAVRAMVEGGIAWQHLREISGGDSEMSGPAWFLLKLWKEIKPMADIKTRKELAQMIHRILQREHDQIIESLKEGKPLHEICRRMVDFARGVSAFVDAFEKQMEEKDKEWKKDPEASALFHDDIDNRLTLFTGTGQIGLKTVSPEQREAVQTSIREKLVRLGLKGTRPDELLRIVHQAVMQNVLAHLMGIKLQIDVPHGIILKMDEEQRKALGTNLVELINNAIKHAKGKEVTIKVGWNEKDKKITVSDDGHGISDTEEIWVKGGRGKSAEGVPGNGDGLYLVRERLRAMGGDIQVTSKSGEGATFEISLPPTMISIEH